MNTGMRASGIILAGGKSRRFGSDKAVAALAGTTLLARAIAALEPLVPEIIIVGRAEIPASLRSVRSVPDVYSDHGPLGGLYSGLGMMSSEVGIAVACDMPLINTSLLAHMLGLLGSHDAVVPLPDEPEPLHAIYLRTCMAPIRQYIESGNLKMTGFLPEVRVRWVSRPEIEQLDPGATSFFNVNTRSDAERAIGLLRQRPQTPALGARAVRTVSNR